MQQAPARLQSFLAAPSGDSGMAALSFSGVPPLLQGSGVSSAPTAMPYLSSRAPGLLCSTLRLPLLQQAASPHPAPRGSRLPALGTCFTPQFLPLARGSPTSGLQYVPVRYAVVSPSKQDYCRISRGSAGASRITSCRPCCTTTPPGSIIVT